MQDMEVPGAGSAPSSPTANKEHDGTVSGKGSSKSSTKMGGTSDPSAGTGTGSAPKKRDPFAPITITDKKDPKTMQAYVPATKAPKNTAMRVVAALGLVGLLAGMVAVGIVVIQRGKDDDTKTTTTTTVAKDIKKTDGKPGDDGPKPPPVADAVIKDIDSAIAADNLKVATDLVEKNKAVLPDEGKPFLARIATRTKIREFLDGAEALLKKKNYAGCLDLIAKSKLTMERVQDLEQRQKHYESARDQMHQQLVGNLQAILKAKDMGKAHDAYVALTKFRDAHKKADWRPNFDEKTYPTELIAKAWKPLLADPAVPADARANLDAVLAYANPKDLERFVPDALYEKNIDALEAFVAAHYADAKTWDSAFKSVVDQLKSNKDPVELYRTLWEAIVPLRGKLRYEDLELLPATRADQQAKDASDKIFAKVIERLVTARNYEWYPDKAQAARLIVWCETRVTDPNLTLRALRAECLVRTGAKAEPLGPHPFPKDTDWYPSFVFAVVKSDSAAGSTKKSDLEDAADSMARILTTEPKAAVNPNERVGVAATLLLAPIRDFKRGGPDGKEFVNDKEAAKAVRWLTALLSLEEKKTQIPLDALVDLAFAAIKSDAPASDAVLTSIAGRMNGLKQDDKMQGYAWLAKAYRADLRAITAQPGKLHPNAISKSKRCQEFAFTSKKNLDPRVATLLYGDAVEIEANAKSANLEVVPRAKVKHDLYMAALNRAKTGKDKSFEDGFALPIVIAMLDRPYELVDADWRAAIDVGKTALKTPEEAWCGDLRATTMVRSADARLYFEMINTKSVPKDEAEALLKLYEDARKSKKYAERYSGEMPFKVGTAHYWLDNRKEAAKELAEARKIIAAIPKPYPPHLREYIDLARSDIDSMVKKKLTNVDKE
jgi:hypothetical protein